MPFYKPILFVYGLPNFMKTAIAWFLEKFTHE